MKKLTTLIPLWAVWLCASMAFLQACAGNPCGLKPDEVPVFITLGQSNADGSAFADSTEDARLAAWYDDSLKNTGGLKIWYRSSYIVNQADGARHVFDGKERDAAPGWMDLYYRNDNRNGRTMMNMIHSYGTWSEGAAGRRGMEAEMAMNFRQAFPDMELYFVKLGCSGSQIETWVDEADSHNWDYFYNQIYLPAMRNLTEQGKTPRLAGIWWMQGEGNGPDSYEHYLPLLEKLIEKCRTRLGFADAKIYVGRIVKPGENPDFPQASTQYGQGVRDAQDAITDSQNPHYIKGVQIIDNRDCPFDADNLHYSHVGINKIGRRIAAEVIESGHKGEWAVFDASVLQESSGR